MHVTLHPTSDNYAPNKPIQPHSFKKSCINSYVERSVSLPSLAHRIFVSMR